MAQLAQARSRQSRFKTAKARLAALPRLDYPLLVTVGVLLIIGLMLIYSGSYDVAFQEYDNAGYFLQRQVVFVAVGLAVALIMARSNYLNWRRISVPLMGAAVLALALVLVAGEERFGARRSFMGGSIQPSEFAKLILVLYIADWLSSKGQRLHDVSYGLMPFAVIIGTITGLIVAEPDYGTAMLILFTALAMLFMAGIDLKQLILGGLVGGATMLALMLTTPHTLERLISFVMGWQSPELASDQFQQVMLALKMGGVTGVGLGNGILRVGYLPLAHTDTIFALAAIELGLLGVVAILALYGIIAYRGVRITLNAPSQYGQLLAFGATAMITIQALINISVMTGILPVTGIPLPFITYGGSSIITTLAAVGVLLSVSRGTHLARKGSKYRAALDRRRGNRRPRVSRAGGR